MTMSPTMSEWRAPWSIFVFMPSSMTSTTRERRRGPRSESTAATAELTKAKMTGTHSLRLYAKSCFQVFLKSFGFSGGRPMPPRPPPMREGRFISRLSPTLYSFLLMRPTPPSIAATARFPDTRGSVPSAQHGCPSRRRVPRPKQESGRRLGWSRCVGPR